MRLHFAKQAGSLFHHLIFLFVSLTVLTGCGEDSEEAIAEIENGDIHGTISNKETGDPIEGASVDIGGKVVLTGGDGKYALEAVPFSDEIDFVVRAANYREYNNTISLHQKILLINIGLIPVESPSAKILEVLEFLSRDIEALDSSRIPFIQSYFSRDYVASDNAVTSVGIWVGVIPSDYDGLPDAILTIIEKYTKLVFKFADPNVQFSGDSASVQMRFEVYAETRPPEPKKWDIVVDGRIDLQRQNGNWKIAYWELVSDFLKFEWKTLE